MSGWVKIPETWFDEESVERMPADVVLVHLSALAYSGRQLLNGRVPRQAVRKLWPAPDLEGAIQQLVTEGHWVPTAVGWQIRDWRTFLLSAEEIEHKRQTSRESSERYRRHQAGDHSLCERCAWVKARDKSRQLSGDTSSDESVTLPEPNRSEPKGRRRGEGGATAPADAGPSAPSDAEQRLGLACHPPSADCCAFADWPEHPIHRQAVAS